MEVLTANLSGKVRRESMNGRDYLVAPLSLIVPGVLNGSKGPLYYPQEEVSRDPTVWNGIPMVVYHPEDQNGNPVSARRPDILNKQGVGYIFNATANGKLRAEGWFDIAAMSRIDNRVLNSLESGTPMELSTGLFTDNEPTEGVHNGRTYKFIARNYKPDHLALLPDRTGACSVADGCGVLIDNSAEVSSLVRELTAYMQNHSPGGKRHDQKKHGKKGASLRGMRGSRESILKSFKIFEKVSTKISAEQIAKGANTSPKSANFTKSLEELVSENKVTLHADDEGKFTYSINPLSGETGKQTVARQQKEMGAFSMKSHTDKVRAIRDAKTTNQLIANALKEYDMELTTEQRSEIVTGLVANCECWKEGEKSLNQMSDHQLLHVANLHDEEDSHDPHALFEKKKKAAMAGKKKKADHEEVDDEMIPAKNQQQTEEENWFAAAPPRVQSVVRNAMALETSQREASIKTITDNERNPFTKKELEAKSSNELKKLATAFASPARNERNPFSPNYSAQAGGAVETLNEEEAEILPLPTINYEELAAS